MIKELQKFKRGRSFYFIDRVTDIPAGMYVAYDRARAVLPGIPLVLITIVSAADIR